MEFPRIGSNSSFVVPFSLKKILVFLNSSAAKRLLILLFLLVLPFQVKAQPSLVNNGSVTGQISTGTEVDEFVFSANAGQAIRISMVDTGATNFYPRVNLYNPDGSLLASSSDSTAADIHCYSTGSCKLLQTGTYKIRVSDNSSSSTGNYQIHFSHIPLGDENGVLVNSGASSGTITTGDIDSYSFVAQAGNAVRISVADTGATSYYPRVDLYNPDGTLLASSSDSTAADIHCYSTGSCKLLQTGTYRIQVTDYYNEYPGNYQVHFSHIPYATENGALINNGAASSDITTGDIDSYSFESKPGNAVRISVADTGATSYYPRVDLYNPDGSLLASSSDSTAADIHCDSTGSCKLLQTGTYRIQVTDYYNEYPGNYQVHFSHIPYASENGALLNNGAVSGDITTGDIDSYSFESKPGNAVRISVADTGATNFYPQVNLYNPDGSLLASSSDSTAADIHCYSTGSCKLLQTGTYRIQVTDYYNEYAGNYQVHFSHIPYANEGGYLITNQGVAGDITTGDIDSYVFYAKSGDSATLNIVDTGNTNFYPQVNLYNPDGSLLASASNSTTASLSCYPAGSCKLLQTGTYRIQLTDYYNEYAGNYQVNFTGPAQPPQPIGQFQWPLAPTGTVPTITQDHTCRGSTNLFIGSVNDLCVSYDQHHTGLDLVPTGANQGVFASAGGSIVSATTNCANGVTSCNSGFGNTVILDHGSGVFSQYSHLKPGTITKTSGFVSSGEKIAEVGMTGNVTGAHLHWELKQHGGLLDSTGTYFGYTDTHPVNYGYVDPWSRLASTSIAPVVVEVDYPAGTYVRRGPGAQYSAMAQIDDAQRFVAFARNTAGTDTWYRIHVPCKDAETCAGWISGTYQGATYAVTKSAEQIEVVGTGVTGSSVRSTVGGSVIGKVYDGQRFAVLATSSPTQSCSGKWYQISTLPASGSPTGWVCGDYATSIKPPPGC